MTGPNEQDWCPGRPGREHLTAGFHADVWCCACGAIRRADAWLRPILADWEARAPRFFPALPLRRRRAPGGDK